MSLTEREIHAKLLKPVGKLVKFKYPGTDVRGLLRDRAIVWSGPMASAVYWDVVDLIEFPNEKYRSWIRISYYRQVGDELRFAGQTSIAEPVPIMKRLLAQAAKQKGWFRKVLVSAIGNPPKH